MEALGNSSLIVLNVLSKTLPKQILLLLFGYNSDIFFNTYNNRS